MIDPIEEYLVDRLTAEKIKKALLKDIDIRYYGKNKLGEYNAQLVDFNNPGDFSNLFDIKKLQGGISFSGQDNTAIQFLSLLPLDKSFFENLIKNRNYDSMIGGMIETTNKLKRPFALTLLKYLARGGFVLDLSNNYEGGFSFKSLKDSLKKELKRTIKNPSIPLKEMTSYITDIAPLVYKYTKKSVENPISTPLNFIDYMSDITPLAKKHSKNIEEQFRQVERKGGNISKVYMNSMRNKIEKTYQPVFYPEDIHINQEPLVMNNPYKVNTFVDRNRDIPYGMIEKYVNYNFQQLPQYVRYSMIKSLYNSVNY